MKKLGNILKQTAKWTLIGFGVLGFIAFGFGFLNALLAQQPAPQPMGCVVDASKLLAHINGERARLGAPQLQTDVPLAVAAKARLDGMVNGKYFSHEMPNNEDWAKPLRDSGVNAALSEDLGANDNTSDQSWQEFKDSPAHYKSLTNPAYIRVGIASECVNYKVGMAVTPEDAQNVGLEITDLTVVILAGAEPAQVQSQTTYTGGTFNYSLPKRIDPMDYSMDSPTKCTTQYSSVTNSAETICR